MDYKAVKLDLDSQYLLYTKYGTISNMKVRVEAIMNYDQANAVPYSIRNLAINEKIIDLESGDTENYLKKQFYYYCTYKNLRTKEINPIIVWDDVIDEVKTTRLSTTYHYTLNLEVDASLTSSLPTIEKSIITSINANFGNSITPHLVSLGMKGSIEDEKSKELALYKERFEIAKGLADKLASLKQIETLINYFAKDDMQEKIKKLSVGINNIQETIATISDMIS